MGILGSKTWKMENVAENDRKEGKMESLPIEILDHVFNQFPSRCEICQQKCLRALAWQEFKKCANTCKRWNLWIHKKIMDLDVLKKCYSEFENLISLTLNTQEEEKFGIRTKIHNPKDGPPFWSIPVIDSITENGFVCRDGRIKIGDSILKVNEISFDNMERWEAENQFFFLEAISDTLKLQCVKLVVGQDPSRGSTPNYLPGYWHWTL